MKRLTRLTILIVGLVACLSCSRSPSGAEIRHIEDFAEKLIAIVKARDSKAYGRLLPNTGDEMINVKTGKAAALPINEEALTQNRSEVEAEFGELVARIEKSSGDVSKLEVLQTSYFIDNDPNLKKLGIFKFDVTLSLSGPNGKATIWQTGCVLCRRGVLIADTFGLQAPPSRLLPAGP